MPQPSGDHYHAVITVPYVRQDTRRVEARVDHWRGKTRTLENLAHSRAAMETTDRLNGRTDDCRASHIRRTGRPRRRIHLRGSVNHPNRTPSGLLRHDNTTHEPDSAQGVHRKIRRGRTLSGPADSGRTGFCDRNTELVNDQA